MTFTKKKKWLLAVSMIVSVPLLVGFAAPTLAGNATAAPLIDKDFETALRKFVSKRFFSRINASDEQRDKLSKIMTETADETRPAREELRQGLLSLNNMMSDEKSSDEMIKAKVQELRALREKVQDKRMSALLEARKILSSEQKQQIHSRINDLLTGNIKARRLGLLMQGGDMVALDQ